MKSIFLITLVYLFTNTALAAQLQINNEAGQPVAGAQIFIGENDSSPLVTDVNGQVEIPKSWTSRAAVTVAATDYLKSTFLDLSPIDNVLQIHRSDSKQKMEISGTAINFENIKRDGKVDFALVYPALTGRQLLRFNVDTIISSEFDIIKIVTEEVAIPSNLALPEQRESYIVPITLNKPSYRMTVGQKGNYRMMATHGQFPLKQVVDEIRQGKSFYEVVNRFSFIGGGQREVTVQDSSTGQDIPVNQFAYSSKVTVKAPNYGNDNVMLSAAMVRQGDLYFSADVKRVEPGQTLDLVIPDSSESATFASVLLAKSDFEASYQDNEIQTESQNEISSVLKMAFTKIFNIFRLEEGQRTGDGDAFDTKGSNSLSFTPASEMEPQFLGFTAKPILSENFLKLSPPNAIDGVESVATYVLLSEVEKVDKGRYTVENTYRVWELAQLGWASELSLPLDQLQLDTGKTYRWEVLFLGKKVGHNRKSEEYFLDGITHVSRNSLDFTK